MSSTSPGPQGSFPTQQSVLEYWLGFDHGNEQALREYNRLWFTADPATDQTIERRFGALMAAAARDELSAWANSAEGRLALILLLDQFPRSVHRGTAAAFAFDAQALALTQKGMAARAERELPLLARMFFYMPLQHSERRADQRESERVFSELSEEGAATPAAQVLEQAARFARVHADIIERFGRFPHRNEAVGRVSTPAEVDYLKGGGPTFGQSRT